MFGEWPIRGGMQVCRRYILQVVRSSVREQLKRFNCIMEWERNQSGTYERVVGQDEGTSKVGQHKYIVAPLHIAP